MALNIGDALIREADRLGQVDLSVIKGRGAVLRPDGTVVFHLGDRILINGEEILLDKEDAVWLAEPRIDLPASATQAQSAEMAKAIMAYRWATPDDGKRLLGWMVAAIVGGALPWRPHMMLAAPATQGKSWVLREVVHRMMGPLLTRIADATPAALARLTSVSSLPLAIDEAEPSLPWIMALFQLLRISSGAEGWRLRADHTSTGVTMQNPRFAALLSSTAVPMLQRADASRLTIVRFGPPGQRLGGSQRIKDQSGNAARGRRASEIHSDGAGHRRASQDTLAEEMRRSDMDSRDALSSAALTAGWRAWGVDDADVYAQSEQPDQSDATDALLEILAIPVRLEAGTSRSLLELLSDDTRDRMVADLYGVKLHDGYLLIAPTHRGLAHALTRTALKQVDLRRLLLQIDGSKVSKHAQRFGSLRRHALVFPPETLEAIGGRNRSKGGSVTGMILGTMRYFRCAGCHRSVQSAVYEDAWGARARIILPHGTWGPCQSFQPRNLPAIAKAEGGET